MTMGHAEVEALWQAHRDAGWPAKPGPDEGELMTLDTVISGCVTYYLEERQLDSPRVTMLQSCLEDLGALLEQVDEGAQPYFARLHRLGELLLHETPPR
jgi:hypothetical protein